MSTGDGGFLETADGGAEVGLAEEGGAGDEGICAGGEALGGGLRVDAAVDLDFEAEFFLFSPLGGGLDFWEGFGDEGLSAESGVNGHDEEEVDVLEVGAGVVDWGGGVEGKSGLEAGGLDLAEEGLDFGAEFGVDGDGVGAGGLERLDEDFGALAHEVDVEEEGGEGAEGFDDVGAEAEVGDEVAVHDVEVEPLGAGAVDALEFSVEAGEVGGEEGGGDGGVPVGGWHELRGLAGRRGGVGVIGFGRIFWERVMRLRGRCLQSRG